MSLKLIALAGLAAAVARPAVQDNALTDDEKKAGWKLLFDGKTAEGWRGYKKDKMPDGWQVVEGVLTRVKGGGDICTAEEFADCYDSTWGRHKVCMHPAVNGHEYHTTSATPYYDYFGAAAGDPSKGYYSYDLGTWHIVVANSECYEVGGCEAGSAQEQWLRQDLASHPAACTLAVIHVPRFSSGTVHGDSDVVQDLWQALYDWNAELVLSGDDHLYERFSPQTPDGRPNTARGIREFVTGTGGRSHYPFGDPKPNSEVRNNDAFGVLKLTLHSGTYDWQFVPEAGKTFADAGTGTCH